MVSPDGRVVGQSAAMRKKVDIAATLATALRDRGAGDFVSTYLFGSHAEGRAHRESDVDVGVLLPRESHQTRRDRFEARLRLISFLAGRLGTNRIDVVVLNEAPPELARRIVTRGRRLACVEPEADHAFVRDVQLRAADL